MNARLLNVAMALSACASSGRYGADLDPELVRSFSALVDSVSFADSRYGWGECCRQTLLVLRPRGTWTFVRIDSTVRWFETAADSVTFRAVTARLIQLGFVAEWPTSFGANASDLPVATLTLRAPGQCHQTRASPEFSGRAHPTEWLAARAMLDSLTARIGWQERSPPDWALVDHYGIAVRSMCTPEDLLRQRAPS